MGLHGIPPARRSHFQLLYAVIGSSPASSSSSLLADFSASSSAGNGPQLARGIASTSCRLDGGGWFDKVKGVFTGKKDADSPKQSFSLIGKYKSFFYLSVSVAPRSGFFPFIGDPSVFLLLFLTVLCCCGGSRFRESDGHGEETRFTQAVCCR